MATFTNLKQKKGERTLHIHLNISNTCFGRLKLLPLELQIQGILEKFL